MAFSQLQLTNAGTRELAKGQVLTLTKLALGEAQVSNVATATNLARKVCEVVPTATSDGDYHVIEGVFDNIALNITAEKQIQEIGVFGKVGNGAETLIYYAKGNAFVFPAKTQQQMTITLPLRIKITGAPEVKVEVNTTLTGLATATAVNEVANNLTKLKTGSVAELAGMLNIRNLDDLMGSVVTEAPLDLDALSAPGLYMFNEKHNATTKGINSNYGFVIVKSNKVGNIGSPGNFTWQMFVTTSGNAFIRYRINANPWAVSGIANGTYFKSLLSRLGLDEWAASISLKECQPGQDLGTFVASATVPVGLNIIRDHNAPAKDVIVWKSRSNVAQMFSPGSDGSFLVGSVNNGRFSGWTNLAQHTKGYTSNTDDLGAYLQSGAVPIGLSMHKDRKSGAFGQVTKFDNNNVYFNGTLRKGGKTYQVVYSIVNGIKPAGFTEWALN